ncbi:UNVERIFIED_CONTAM: hypothetical protein FKN15_025121 [Acipenser sinensis]
MSGNFNFERLRPLMTAFFDPLTLRSFVFVPYGWATRSRVVRRVNRTGTERRHLGHLTQDNNEGLRHCGKNKG